MSKGVNKVILVGNLGADGELRYTQGGTAVLNLRLAVTTQYKKDDGWEDRTTWVSVVVWGKRGEALSKILAKGEMVYVEGELRMSEYEKDGQKREKAEVHANDVLLCGGSKKGGAPAAEEDTSFNYGANAPAAKPDDRRAAPPAKGNRPWEKRS